MYDMHYYSVSLPFFHFVVWSGYIPWCCSWLSEWWQRYNASSICSAKSAGQ